MSYQTIVVPCRGVDCGGNDVLEEAIEVRVSISSNFKPGVISVDVADCPFNTGSRGMWCNAIHGEPDFPTADAVCRFSFEYPYVKQHQKIASKIPAPLQEALERIHGS